MRGGIWVLNIFAAIWAAGGIVAGHGPVWLAVASVALSVALLIWSSRQPLGTNNPVSGAHIGRVIGIATVVEFVAIFIVANLLGQWGMPTLVLPAVAIIVGLHFLPIARWVPVPLYYGTGFALIAVGVVAALAPPADRTIATGIAAAIVLWVSGILLTRNGRG